MVLDYKKDMYQNTDTQYFDTYLFYSPKPLLPHPLINI